LNESLHSQLSELHPAQPLEFAIKHALGEAARRRESGRRRLLGRSLVPLAAAATVAGVLAVRSSGPATDPESRTRFAAAAVHAASGAESVDVTAPDGTNVAVFKTSNPNIVVFWFYEGGEGR